jgi:hypothetical protein
MLISSGHEQSATGNSLAPINARRHCSRQSKVETARDTRHCAQHEVSAYLKPPTTGRVLEVSAAMAILHYKLQDKFGLNERH